MNLDDEVRVFSSASAVAEFLQQEAKMATKRKVEQFDFSLSLYSELSNRDFSDCSGRNDVSPRLSRFLTVH